MSSAATDLPTRVTVVVPTVGRPSLAALLARLRGDDSLAGVAVLVVDDRPRPGPDPLPGAADADRVLASGGRGPAAARNIGWSAARTGWVAFLDDDVLPEPGWGRRLGADLDAADAPDDELPVGGVTGRIEVPSPPGRRPTDWERQVQGLSRARWITADIAYRRPVLEAVGGFAECFPDAYREDADLALRVRDAGFRIVAGSRRTCHPVPPAPWWVSITRQRGNRADPLMARRHGHDWRVRAGVPRGARRRHAAVTGAAATAVLGRVLGRRRLATVGALAWAAGTAHFAWSRIRPGPRDPRELLRMVVTSVAIPPLASVWWLRGQIDVRLDPRALPDPAGRRRLGQPSARPSEPASSPAR